MRNQKGITLVLMAILLLLLLIFASLAIDIAYMYFAKNELQVAADASALAGVAKLYDTNHMLTPDLARQSAWQFACKNRAAGGKVFLQVASDSCDNIPNATDLNYSNSDTGDIVLGHWNRTTRSFTPQLTDVNAVKTVARRTADSPGGPVKLFFGKVMGWNVMSARSEAIAALTPYATPGIVFCMDACGLSMPHTMVLQDNTVGIPDGMAWTEFGSKQAPNIGSGGDVLKYIRGELEPDPDKPICQTCIKTNNGTGVAINVLYDVFTNPNYRRNDKEIECDMSGHCVVKKWTVAIPILNDSATCLPAPDAACPPGKQGTADDNYYVEKMAVVRITQVRATGGGSTKGIVIDQLDCGNCTNYLYSNYFHLVK